MKYTEDTLSSWTSPLSQTEEQRVENTIRMIKDAVTSYDKLSDCTMEVFAQGSYANNTNVRQDSDVDICVMLTSTVFCNYVDGKTDEDYGYTTGSITYNDYKSYIVEALKGKFGEDVVAVGNKSINIKSNSYHVNADVVPAFQYRDFKIINSIDPAKYVEGIKYFAKDGIEHHNIVFSDTLEVIENIILFSISNYFLRFSNEYRRLKGDEALDENNWYEYVEYGTTNPLTILLQRNGFSRESARYVKEHREYVITDGSTGKLKLKASLAECGNTDVRNEVIYVRQNSPGIFIEE